MINKKKQIAVISALAEGASIGSVHRDTGSCVSVCALAKRAPRQCRRLESANSHLTLLATLVSATLGFGKPYPRGIIEREAVQK